MTANQRTILRQLRAAATTMGITVTGVLSFTWAAITLGEKKFIRPYVEDIVRVEVDSLMRPYSAKLDCITKDIGLVREIMELSVPDSTRRKAVRNIREKSVWATPLR